MRVKFLEECIHYRDNNFNLLRFIAAFAVLFCHAQPVIGNAITPINYYAGFVAVDVFFITSGFLVTRSLLSRNDITFFIASRSLRILPGLFVNLMFCTFIVGTLFTTLPLKEYLIHRQIFSFFYHNVNFFSTPKWQLPGVFDDNHIRSFVNISLWTLHWEVRMYAGLALLGVVALFINFYIFQKIANVIITIVFVISLFLYIYNYINTIEFDNLSRFTSMFTSGAFIYLHRTRIIMSKILFIFLCLILSAFLLNTKWLFIPYLLSIGYLVIFLAFYPKGVIRRFNKLPDYSYGIYIYGFPVQQAIAVIYPAISLTSMLFYSFVVTVLLASLSWHFVEKPALAAKKYFQFTKPLSVSKTSSIG